jgi:ubiquinone biosynthesis protein COQ4
MQTFTDASNPTPRLQPFLDLIDRITEARGENIPPIVNHRGIAIAPSRYFWQNLR